MITTNFFLDARRAEAKLHSLRINICQKSKTASYPLGIRIAKNQWNIEAQRIENHPDAKYLNNLINKRKVDVDSVILRLEEANPAKAASMTAVQIRDYVVATLSPKKEENSEPAPEPKKAPARAKKEDPKNFKALLVRFAETHEKENTKNKYYGTYKRIVAWIGEEAASTMLATDITLMWLEDFDKFLCKTSPAGDSRGIHFRNLKAVLNYGIRHDLFDRNPVTRFKIPKSVPKKKNLGVEAMRRIIFAQCLEPWMEKYRDFFVLSFMLRGLNTIDLCHMTKPINGRVDWVRTKTSQPLSLKIEPEMQMLIDKYRGSDLMLEFAEGRNYRYFNNKLSRAMHKIRECINKHTTDGFVLPEFTMYWARYTWASVASSIDIAFDTISVGLAHSLNRITDLYIERDPRKIDNANRKVLDYVLYDIDPTAAPAPEAAPAPKKRGRPKKTA